MKAAREREAKRLVDRTVGRSPLPISPSLAVTNDHVVLLRARRSNENKWGAKTTKWTWGGNLDVERLQKFRIVWLL